MSSFPDSTSNPPPIGSSVSLATTIAVVVAALGIERSALGTRSFVDVRFWLILLLAFVGVLVNIIGGIAAHRRGEVWGARIAGFGIAVSLVTVLWAYADGS